MRRAQRLLVLALAAALGLGVRHVLSRLATHQKVVPRLVTRSNTQVHRINQRRATIRES